MSAQGRHKSMPLFDRPAPNPPHNGTPTSAAAAQSIKLAASTQRWCIMDLLKSSPEGLTDEEIQDLSGMSPSSERPRRGELVDMGKVRDTGRTKPTKSGRMAILWEVIR